MYAYYNHHVLQHVVAVIVCREAGVGQHLLAESADELGVRAQREATPSVGQTTVRHFRNEASNLQRLVQNRPFATEQMDTVTGQLVCKT